MSQQVTVTHLEMTDRSGFCPAEPFNALLTVIRAEIPCPDLNRFLYVAVGRGWSWTDRLSWSRAKWKQYLDRPELETWVAYVKGTPAGYFELERQPGENVEIVYFGLLPEFVGRGLGGALLSQAVERAWEMGSKRVWLHTCDLDHPAALRNYQARGFRIFKTEFEKKTPEDFAQGQVEWP
jgi:ribosomal protein S18 acetylase RimI-like enzyme